MDQEDYDPNDPERHLKRIDRVFGVSSRIQNLVLRRKKLPPVITSEEKLAEKLKNVKEQRTQRLGRIGFKQNFLLEMISLHLNVDLDTLIDCAADSEEHIRAIEQIFEANGTYSLLVQYQETLAPGIESGRFNPKLRHEKTFQALFSSGIGKKISGKSVFVYRLSNVNDVDVKNLGEELFFSSIPDEDYVISSILNNVSASLRPALETSKEYGNCSDGQKFNFIHGVDLFLKFLKTTQSDIINCMINFEVSHDLYKGHLLAPHQVEATAKKPDKVAEVEREFAIWMKKIENAMVMGHQIRQNTEEVGPADELDHWRSMLTKYNNIIEFTNSKPFLNYLSCLKLSRSKLVKKWHDIDNDVVAILNEARDNVKYMTSIEQFWDPLYRCDPPEIIDSLPSLLQAIVTVYRSSKFYTSSERVTGFLSKVTNQIIIACQSFLTNREKDSIWTQNQREIVKKIDLCKSLLGAYKERYYRITKEMNENPEEKPWECSEVALFGRLETFNIRLNKIKEILEIILRYKILDYYQISGMDVFSESIKKSFQIISEKEYDPLAHRHFEFDKDFNTFQMEIDNVELEMQKFVKDTLSPMCTTDQRLLTLKRFERLKLDCLCLDRRYLDAAELLEKEIADVKDYYNEDRANPPLEWNTPTAVGRIMWIRNLFRKIDEPMKVFRSKGCVIEHKRAQLCVKYYNYLSGVFLHYEMLYHKAWYEHVEQVRTKLETPIIRKNLETKMLEVNLDRYVIQVIRETETMCKLGLEVPMTPHLLIHCKEKVLDAHDIIVSLIDRNNKLRKSIPPMFLPLMRTQLIELERIFAQGLAQLTWVSLKLTEYFEEIDSTLTRIERFVKDVVDINDARIEVCFDEIEMINLIDLPEDAVSPEEFLEMNQEHRRKVEKILAWKAKTAEIATIELITRFVDAIDVTEDDEIGRRKFQLPPNLITDENWRIEEKKPIDKYDWIHFGKIFKAVMYPLPEVNLELCFKEYDGLKYDVNLLHIDCIELFAYYNQRLISALVKCTKSAMEKLKSRTNLIVDQLSEPENNEPPILTTWMELKIPDFMVTPSIPQIQEKYEAVIANVIEANHAVSTWGKLAKTPERNKRKPLIDEIRYDKNFHQIIENHKEVFRFRLGFDKGLMQKQTDVNNFSKELFEKYKFLWDEDREDQIEKFVEKNPLTVDIRDRLLLYDKITEDILNMEKIIVFGPIKIFMDRVIPPLTEESKSWKIILGRKLSAFYKTILDEMVQFISAQLKVLNRDLNDLEDCRIAMLCLGVIRDNFIRIDQTLDLIEATYSMFHSFNISITSEDNERVESLRYMFTNMQHLSEKVAVGVVQMQPPLMKELEDGLISFKTDLEQFEYDFEHNGPMIEGIPAKEASDRVLWFQSRYEELWRRFERYTTAEELFGMPKSDYPVLHKRKKDFNLLNKLYSLYLQVMKTIDEYCETPWSQVDMEKINADIQEFHSRCKKLPRAMKDWAAFIDLKKKIDDFYESCPLIELMADKSMKERHWEKIEAAMEIKYPVDSPTFTLGDVLETPILEFKDEIEDVCVGAVKEKDIESKLKQVVAEWSQVSLTFAPFKTRGELLIKSADVVEIVANLEDSLMVVSSLASNRFNAPFKKDILLWQQKLSNTNEILERWMQVQNLWVYLEAVFVGGDIAKQLPGEAKRFTNIDRSWVRIMYKARDNPIVVDCCTSDDIIANTLNFLLQQLEACQKSLTGYLESKRLIFPRFFFISDPVLLEILGQASDPKSIQPHLESIFGGVSKVAFEGDKTDEICSMLSENGEEVLLNYSVKCIGHVELWLGKLLSTVQETIKTVLSKMTESLRQHDFSFIAEIPNYCAQAGLMGLQLLWTADAEFALNKARKFRKIMQSTNKKFLDLLNSLVDLTTKDLTKLERISIETMITIHVHQRDIFDDLVNLKIMNANNFEWQKQSRFYYEDETEEVFVKITDITFAYQNEYLGVKERLAITPLTDRCYITLAQAIGMCMGGAPAGPAGTGKTETVKDMAGALGKYVIVFNCSDQMDFRGLGRIFKGLAQSGSWGCFDEFNRIDLPVLSVAAQQIHIVLSARKQKVESFIFSDGDKVTLNAEFGIFITMNPGYAGRQELPENLKIQFRSVAMMVPDRQIIMRVKLASCGFRDNIVLARKFFTLYKLCEEQLSKQIHYDFGLRNILSCLRTLGSQKRAAPPKTKEDVILMRVLKDMNLSKLVDEDEPLFKSLISDLFPGIEPPSSSYKELQQAIQTATEEFGLINEPSWNLKVIQLYETSLVRHGLMVLGPTGAGKTKCMNTLLRAFTIRGDTHKEFRMNPKAITAPQMFGRLDPTTNDWTDGIFSVLWRRTLKFKKEYVWLVIDGPVDAVYIENLNSVLDDNKTLTLANGDRIVMSPNCKLVFEPDNVDNASPATISRMGMVFMSSSVLQWSTFVEAWYKTLPAYQIRSLKRSFDKIYADLLLFVETKLEAKMKVLEANYIRQTCDLLTGLLNSPHETQTKFSDSHIERLFLFSLMWSLGSVIELEDRTKMEEFILQHPSKMRWPKLEGDESIFEFLVSSKGQWEHWNTQITEYIYPSDKVPEYSEILVPNVDNVRTAFLIDLIANQKKSVLLIGEQGTAKTVMIKGYMSQYDPEEHMSKSLNFSSATSPNMFQRIIESYMEKRVGTTYGPPQMRKMSIFIDDINMPMLNEWGDQITNEIVRQLMEAGGFYSLDRPGDFSTIMDIQILAAMIHPGGGRNDIPARLKRQFNVFNCTLPTITSMDKIFGIIGRGYFCSARFKSDVVNFVSNLIPLTRILWQYTKQKMLPTPAKFHYIFNLRDLSRIWGGMLKIQSAQCQNVNTLLKLWRHECIRVFADRFTTFEDKDWFTKKMNEIAQQELGADYQYFPQEDSYFVDFLQDSPDVLPEDDEEISDDFFVYEEIPSFDVVKTRIEFFMALYNKEVRGAKLDLVLFQDALIHLMIISRILRTSRGNALLVGVGGSGKQSLTKLASFIAGYKNHQITLTRAYNITNLADDFKYLYKVAGFDGDGITFIFTDNDIKDESFLEYLNNVLNSGEIANLFTKEEIDEITSELVPIMKKADPRRIPSNDNLYEFFISRARKNLHVVLCFSPVGEKFRSRALKFPGLISGCVIDWFQKWPMDALVEVSKHFLTNYSVQCTDNVKEQLIQMMAYVQDYISGICIEYFERFRRQTHVTPKSFLTFLEGYKVIYTERKENISMLADRMVTGLVKLDEAADQVSTLKVEIEKKKEEILVKEAEVQIVLDSVQEATEKANIAKGEVDISIEKQDVLVREIDAEAKITEEKLLLAQPALEEAENALKTIKNTDIATVRKLANPPHLITVIMDVVCIMFRRRVESVKIDVAKKFLVTSWNESLKVMADTRFLIKIVNYNRDLINAEMIDLMIPYFKYPQYTFEAAKTACGNVAGLLQWTKAMAKFFDVNKDILPLKANLKIQRLKHAKANEALQELEDTLITKLEEVRKLEMMCEQATGDLQVVKEEAQLYQDKLNAATEMIEGLSEEKINWTLQTKAFEDETIRLVGDSVILIGFLSYTGPFNQEYRALVQKHWYDELIRRRIPVSGSIDLIDTLTDPATVGEWKLQGLPNDELSIQNAIIVTQATRYPLLIDPQSQGKSWIKNREKEYGLVVTSLNHRYFRNHFEDAVSYGTPLLIEDVGEELDPCMDNVLERNYIKMGTSWKVKVGDKEIDTNEEFRLYITTKLSNPVYTPEVTARTSIIDFAVTMRGLEDQLLGRVILSERKEMEAERVNLISDVTSMKRLKKDLEADLLKKLSTASGSLLDDLSVMEVLNSNKEKSIEIRDKMETTEVTVANINTAREEFRPIATRGSILYFLIVSMSQVNNMYQTSLVQFLERFDFSLERADKSPITYKRIRLIIEYLTYDIFKYKSRGLYETHKFLFVLLMALNIDLEREKITFEEFQTFIKGGAALDINSCPVKPCKWITDMTWLNLVALSSLRQFNSILEHIGRNEKMWRVWFEKNAPEEEPMPDTYKEMDEFRKLLLIRSWCADRTLLQSRKYISSSLGERFASPFVLDYDELFEESRALSPIICLLSMGSDPTPSIEQLAKKNELRLNSISMGQGQEVHARKLILKSLEKGRWVLLQNCHLSLEYMSELMDQLTDLQMKGPEAYHENFRLWITTECHKDFPITLLQVSVKFTNEPPSGVKAGLMKTYRSMSSDIMEYSINKYYIGIIYTISFLHTIVQERRKFGPLGWNVPYEFNLSDWIASCYFTQNHLDEVDPKKPEDINWNTVRYMIGEVQYGGRVTDDFDKRFLICLTNAWFFDNMFEPEFEFYKGYNIISKKTTEDYLEEIDKLPSIDSPEVCKLHPNADITFQTNKAKEILDTIISIQPKESAGTGGETRESVVSRVVNEMLEKVPEPYLEYEVKERLTKTISSMNIFLRQEIDRIQKVIHLVRNTLTDLLLAIEGTIIMNEDLRDAFDNIYDARVPKIWIRYSWISSTLGFWFTELIERNNQFYSWCFKARPPMFWMSGFFNPQGFLTAMKQEVARANNGWALDKVALHNEVTKISAEDCKDPPKSGVYVYGLFLDGAGWQRKTCSLIESTNKVLYTVMPIIHIDAINSTAPKHPSLYECPVYKKPSRTGLNFITPLWLQSQKPPDHWVLRGVALLCDIK